MYNFTRSWVAFLIPFSVLAIVLIPDLYKPILSTTIDRETGKDYSNVTYPSAHD